MDSDWRPGGVLTGSSLTRGDVSKLLLNTLIQGAPHEMARELLINLLCKGWG